MSAASIPGSAPAPGAIQGNPEEFDFRVLFPGEDVPLPGTDLTLKVFPLGIEHMATFPQEVALILRAVTQVRVQSSNAGLSPAQINLETGRAIAEQIMPLVAGRALKLMMACCHPRLKNPPHWLLPPITEAWARQSFGVSALDPWRAAVEKLLENLTGRQIRISELWSRLSSAAATLARTSLKPPDAGSTANPSAPADTPTPKSSTGPAGSDETEI